MKGVLTESQQGVGLISVVVILLIVGIIGAIFVSLINTESFTAMNQSAGLEAFGIADAGIERAVYEYNSGTACAALATGAPVSLGNGSFTVLATLYNPSPPTTLDVGGINDTVTTIPVVSTAGYAPHGRITIESEDMDYTAIVGNTFTGALRGANGTTAVGHAFGKRVRQKQCLITSTGTVPGPLSSAQRIVEVSVR